MNKFRAFSISSLLVSASIVAAQAADLGIFSSSVDIGHPKLPGSVIYNAADAIYLITGGGSNIWAAADDGQFVYKEMSGDLDLLASVTWPKPGGNPHRKATLMIRQSLDGDSPYVDVAQHGVGLTALQFRETKGGPCQEILTSFSGPARIGIEKRGDYFSFWISEKGEALHPAGGSFKLKLTGPFLVGLMVCAHDNKVAEQAGFSKVELTALAPLAAGAKGEMQSTLEFMPVQANDRTIVFHTNGSIQSPNWTRENQLIFSADGRIYKIGITNGTLPEPVNITSLRNINGDHGISPDGTKLAISAGKPSRIYVGPIAGGSFKLITPTGPSYFHGWSPDGRALAFSGQRVFNGAANLDVYTIPATGGKETRLTTAPGIDDGPEFSPDGQYIYFHSDRSGLMQIWRMKTDGSEQTQITPDDDCNNAFPQISPNGRNIVFLTFARDIRPDDHLEYMDASLRMKPVDGGKLTTLAKFLAGEGSSSAAAWSPDSRNISFVTYTTIYPR